MKCVTLSEDHEDRCIILLYAMCTPLQLERSAVPATILITLGLYVSACELEHLRFHLLYMYLHFLALLYI